jgi:hypothetical protein
MASVSVICVAYSIGEISEETLRAAVWRESFTLSSADKDGVGVDAFDGSGLSGVVDRKATVRIGDDYAVEVSSVMSGWVAAFVKSGRFGAREDKLYEGPAGFGLLSWG